MSADHPGPAFPASPSNLVIRSARSADAGRLAHLLSLGALDTATEDPTDDTPYRQALTAIDATQRNDVLVAERNGHVIGFCQVFAIQHLQERGGLCAEIESVHVHPSYRRQGVGRALLAAAVDQAHQWGCYRVQLTSNKARTDAHHLYRNVGFEPTHEGYKLRLQPSRGCPGARGT